MATIGEAMVVAVRHHKAGELERAKDVYEQVLQAAPDHPDARHLLGVLAHQTGESQAAVEHIRRAIKSYPDAAAFHCNLGVAYRALDRFDEAVACYQRALRLTPDYAEAHNNLGNALEEQDRLDEAAASYRRALQLNPEYPEALANLGNVFRLQGEFDEAIDSCRQALSIKPDHAPAHNNLGAVLMAQRKFPEAEASYRRAVEIDPDNSKWHNHLGVALKCRGEMEAAVASFRESLRIEPDQPLQELQVATTFPMVFESNQEIDQCHDKLMAELKRLSEKEFPLDFSRHITGGWDMAWNLLFHGRNNRPIKEALANVFRGCFPEAAPTVRAGRPRVGFVVTNSHEGIFLRFMQGILEHINPDLFELLVVCSQAGEETIRAAINSESVQTLPLPERLDRVADTIRAARFDLLYYWEVGTDMINYFLPFFRLAPVQCTSGGILGTTGISEMDYYLTWEHLETEDSDSHYTETLIRAKTGLVYISPRALPVETKPREAFGFTAEQHLYLCPQRVQKYHPDFDSLLAGILRRDPLGVVVLLGVCRGSAAYRLCSRFMAAMPELVDRLILRGRQPFDDYLSLLAAADVILDPLHYGGGTTSHDALSLGKPIVTLPSQFSLGRGTLALYKTMGVMDCVASTPQQYVDMAVRLATDADYRATVEERIRATSHLLFENTEAVRELEQIFGELIEKARSLQTTSTVTSNRPKSAARG